MEKKILIRALPIWLGETKQIHRGLFIQTVPYIRTYCINTILYKTKQIGLIEINPN
jgi:hypothetical protein